MKYTKIVAAAALLLALVGCTQKLPASNMAPTVDAESESKTAVYSSKQEESKIDISVTATTENSDNKMPTSSTNSANKASTSAQTTNSKQTAAPQNKPTVASTEQASSPTLDDSFFFIINNSEGYYSIDDSKVKENQSTIRGGSLIRYFTKRVATNLETHIVTYTYGEKDWVVVLNKGIFIKDKCIGAEAVILCAPDGMGYTGNETYFVPKQSDIPSIEMDITETETGKRYKSELGRHWAETVYFEAPTDSPDDLTAECRIVFPDEQAATQFAQGLINEGFTKTDGNEKLNDNCFESNGKEVNIRF